jgi:hypothetical protein
MPKEQPWPGLLPELAWAQVSNLNAAAKNNTRDR